MFCDVFCVVQHANVISTVCNLQVQCARPKRVFALFGRQRQQRRIFRARLPVFLSCVNCAAVQYVNVFFDSMRRFANSPFYTANSHE